MVEVTGGMVCIYRFVKCDEMAADVLNAVVEKKMTIEPESPHEATWFRWLKDPRDWCISRQLWWGHRIPAYRLHCKNTTLSLRKFLTRYGLYHL